MDNHVLELINQIHDLCHRIDGYLDAKADLKPDLKISWNTSAPKVLVFPTKNETPLGLHPTADILKITPDVGTSDDKTKQGFVEFTDEEIKQMPKTVQNLIIVNKKRCRMRKHQSGKNTFTYELRYRRDGFDISASGVTLILAKERMIEKLKNAVKKDERPTVPTTFAAFANYFFENFRLEKVTSQTYKKDKIRLKLYLLPYFKETPIKKILPAECKALYKNIQAQGKGKTASEVYSLMSIIFKGAIAHGIINKSPLDLVLYTPYVSESGTALSKEEEKILFDSVADDELSSLAFALLLYTGLRPNELPTAQRSGEFIIAKNSKRKNGKIEFKKIPIIKRLRPYIDDKIPILPSVKILRTKIRTVLPTHKLYDLRTTFYTRCDECGVSAPARDEFVGHSSGKLTDAYRDLSETYLLKEGKKLNSW